MHAAGTRLGLCSNKPDDLCRLLVRDFGLDTLFDEVLENPIRRLFCGLSNSSEQRRTTHSTLVTAKPTL
jgi:hypothetical protein